MDYNTHIQNGRVDDPVYYVVQNLVDGTTSRRRIGIEMGMRGRPRRRCSVKCLRFVKQRYMEGLKIEKIGDRMNYSESSFANIELAQ